MATQKQKDAARHNLEKARAAQSARAHGKQVPQSSDTISTHDKNQLRDTEFAFPEQRKEPLTDADHVRNAIARFDQVEGVSNADREKAWGRITRAARRFDIEVSEKSWHDLMRS